MNQKMNPKQLLNFFAAELNKGRSIVMPKLIIKDALIGLTKYKGFSKKCLVVHEYEKKDHVSLTLKKYVAK